MHQSLQPVWCCDKIKINNMTLLAQVQQYTDIGLEKPCSILLCNVQFWQGTVKTAQTCKYKTYGTFEGPGSYEIWSWSIFPWKSDATWVIWINFQCWVRRGPRCRAWPQFRSHAAPCCGNPTSCSSRTRAAGPWTETWFARWLWSFWLFQMQETSTWMHSV